jgi:hypothetical protein
MMMRFLGLSLAVLACVGCGGAKLGGGKEGAAQALASASSAALTANSFAGASGGTASYQCPHGGSVVATASMGSTTPNASFTAEYNGCSIDGHNKLDGTLTTTMSSESSSTGGAFVMQMVGEIDISGDISDFLRANITQRMTYTTSTSGSTMSMHATIVLDGSIETSTAQHVYAAETYDVDMSAELPRG